MNLQEKFEHKKFNKRLNNNNIVILHFNLWEVIVCIDFYPFFFYFMCKTTINNNDRSNSVTDKRHAK